MATCRRSSSGTLRTSAARRRHSSWISVGHGADEAGLVAEVVADGGLVDAGLAGHVLQRDGLVAALGQQLVAAFRMRCASVAGSEGIIQRAVQPAPLRAVVRRRVWSFRRHYPPGWSPDYTPAARRFQGSGRRQRRPGGGRAAASRRRRRRANRRRDRVLHGGGGRPLSSSRSRWVTKRTDHGPCQPARRARPGARTSSGAGTPVPLVPTNTMLVWALARSTSRPGTAASASARRRQRRWSSARRADVVAQRVQAAGRDDARLAHAAAEHLAGARARPPAASPDQHRAHRRAQALGEADAHGIDRAA